MELTVTSGRSAIAIRQLQSTLGAQRRESVLSPSLIFVTENRSTNAPFYDPRLLIAPFMKADETRSHSL